MSLIKYLVYKLSHDLFMLQIFFFLMHMCLARLELGIIEIVHALNYKAFKRVLYNMHLGNN